MMTSSGHLMEVISRFSGEDVSTFREEWNGKIKHTKQEEKEHEIQQSKDVVSTGISIAIRLKYQTSSGQTVTKDVIIRRVVRSGKENYLDVITLNDRVPRLIRVSSVSSVADPKASKIYDSPAEFFQNFLGLDVANKTMASSMKDGEMKTAIDMTRHEITALLYVSGVDGNRDERELKKIVQYVHRRCPNLSFNDEALMRYLRLVVPDTESFYLSLERILGKDGWVVKMFLDHLMELIMADGHADEREKIFLADFLGILNEEGFDIEFPKDK